ncbi:hypothetical protein IRY55_12915 [Savagea sp. SN6]|uniref:Uncharacterized protein n=1 Tax=Savagea serpentis TaxID=2785297 RepID=A0A8J7G6E9_9BACL|nr:hypothetical protein [Savagea serpentis]MBF4502262.1 hypothetical protein [Savagea serpentis]
MNLIKKEILTLLSLLCAIGVFLMSSAFQSMAYWGNDSTWYWVGVVFTYFLELIGIVFLVFAIKRKTRVNGESKSSLLIFGILTSVTLLIGGFLWTTFVIIAGISGI